MALETSLATRTAKPGATGRARATAARAATMEVTKGRRPPSHRLVSEDVDVRANARSAKSAASALQAITAIADALCRFWAVRAGRVLFPAPRKLLQEKVAAATCRGRKDIARPNWQPQRQQRAPRGNGLKRSGRQHTADHRGPNVLAPSPSFCGQRRVHEQRLPNLQQVFVLRRPPRPSLGCRIRDRFQRPFSSCEPKKG